MKLTNEILENEPFIKIRMLFTEKEIDEVIENESLREEIKIGNLCNWDEEKIDDIINK